MAEELRPEGIPVTVGEVVITTPGLTGEVEVHAPGTPGMRGEEQATEDFRQALDDAGMAEQLSVVVSRHQEVTPGEGTRGSGGGDDIVVNVPAPGEGNGQVLLYAAEDGSLSWHLADDVPPTAAPDRGGERRTYRIPRAVVPVDEREPAETRGILGAIGKKVLKVLVFPLVDPILGKVGDHFAKRWEAKNRLNRVRWMTVDGYRSSVADPFAAADWARLGEGRALVLVHGTFSTAHGRFGSLPKATMTALHAAYGGRVVAFEHHSVSVTPKENAELLAGLVPDGAALEVDLVTHSRGGLVGREIAGCGRRPDRHGPGDGRLAQRRHRPGRPRAPLRPARPDHRPRPVRPRQRGHRDHRPGARRAQAAGRRCGGRPRRDHGDEPERGLPEEAQRPPRPGRRPPRRRGRLRAAAGRAAGARGPRRRDGPGVQGGRQRPGRADRRVLGRRGAPGFPIDERLVLDQSRSVDHNSFFRQPEVSERLLEWLPS